MDYVITVAGEAFALRYTFNSLCAMEAVADGSLGRILKRPFTAARLLLWGGLQKKQLSLNAAGELLERHLQSGGRLDEILDGCMCAMEHSGFLDLNQQE